MITALVLFFIFGLLAGMPLLFVVIGSSIVPGLVDAHFIGNIQYVMRSIVGGGDNTAILACPCFILSW